MRRAASLITSKIFRRHRKPEPAFLSSGVRSLVAAESSYLSKKTSSYNENRASSPLTATSALFPLRKLIIRELKHLPFGAACGKTLQTQQAFGLNYSHIIVFIPNFYNPHESGGKIFLFYPPDTRDQCDIQREISPSSFPQPGPAKKAGSGKPVNPSPCLKRGA